MTSFLLTAAIEQALCQKVFRKHYLYCRKMYMEPISKAKIKWIRSLQQKKVREEENVFVVEGEKMVLEGLDSALQPIAVIVHKEHTSLLSKEVSCPLYVAGSNEMEQLSGLKTPNKLVAVFRKPEFQHTEKGIRIVLDGVQDPGNMGTILRLADWFGISEIICSNDTVDCFNPKVVQASMGAIFRIRVSYVDLPEFLNNNEFPVYGALLNGTDYRKTTYAQDAFLLMGNEGKGISETLLPFISEKVTIPRYGEAESLNVATATAILLAEMRR